MSTPSPARLMVARGLSAIFAAALLSFASAQPASGNVAASAVIAYANLLAPTLVGDVRATFDAEPADAAFAEAILSRMFNDQIIEEAVYLTFSDTILLNAPLSQGFFELWLLDVITGTEPLIDVLVDYGFATIDANGEPSPSLASFTNDPALDFETVLASEAPGLAIPERNEDGFIGDTTAVDTAIVTILEDPDLVEELQQRYDDAISPTNPDDVASG